MPDFLPFRGLRYRSGSDLSAVSAPPYDVIDEDERAALEHADPHNAVRLILPRPAGDHDAYRAAADLLAEWRAEGVLARDDAAQFYGYRMTYIYNGVEQQTIGIIGALALTVDGPANEQPVLPHERTLPKARSDRLALLRATRANFDPIWGLSLASGLSGLVPDDAPIATSTDSAGTRHELLPIADAERIAAVREVVTRAPVVLADGHHRYETAGNYFTERGDDSSAAAIMALVVELSEHHLCVQAIHRLLSGTGAAEVRTHAQEAFTVIDAGPNTPESVQALERRMLNEGGIGLVDAKGLALALPRAEVLGPRLQELAPAIRSVDAAAFDAGIRPHLPEVQLQYRDDAGTVSALVAKGVADAAVLLRPVSIEQIRTAAIDGVRMPEKTTYFYPKPRTGMVMRSLDD